MPIDPHTLCSCHGEPMYRSRRAPECVIKRRARTIRYQASGKGREAKRMACQHFNARRVRIGERYLFAASTPDEALRIRAHIKRRDGEFRQSRQTKEDLSVALP